MTGTATGDLFPGNALGRILSLQSTGFGIGGALGAYAGGYFYDITGSYIIPFTLLLVIILSGIGGIWLAAPRRSALV
jgi:MFS family permease